MDSLQALGLCVITRYAGSTFLLLFITGFHAFDTPKPGELSLSLEIFFVLEIFSNMASSGVTVAKEAHMAVMGSGVGGGPIMRSCFQY